MMKSNNVLHIINGDDLAQKTRALDLPGQRLTWREFLSEGPTATEVGESEFVRLREQFLRRTYGIRKKDYREKFLDVLTDLKSKPALDEIVLWFEFDLFSHMNVLALISFLQQHNRKDPLSLVCSKRLSGEEELVPLSELSKKSLKEHYKHRIPLNRDDIATAQLIWEFYCSSNPKRLASEVSRTTNFEYLASSIRAHIGRFPNVKTGLNTLETNVLKLISEHEINSTHQLLGYALQYQGYYGYVDVQMERVIEKCKPFFEDTKKGLSLNQEGHLALEGKKNFYRRLKDDESYGGVRKYDFLYNPDNHDLLKL